MKKSLLAGTAMTVALIASGACAEGGMGQDGGWRPESGWYGAIDAGGQKNWSFDATAAGTDQGFKIRTNVDWAGFVRLGYRVNPYLRFELEGGYRAAGLQSANGFKSDHGADICAPGSTGLPNCGKPEGNMGAWTGMFDGLVDLFPHWRISPFIGGGVGIVGLKTNIKGSLAGPGSRPSHPWTLSSRSRRSAIRESAASAITRQTISTSI